MDEHTPHEPGPMAARGPVPVPRLEGWPGAGQEDGEPEDGRPEVGPFEVLVGVLLLAMVLAGGVLTLAPAEMLTAPVRRVGLVLIALGLAAGTVAVLVHARRAGMSWPAVLWRTVCAPFRLGFSLLP